MIVIVVFLILIVGYVGVRFFYYAPGNAVNMVERVSPWQALSSVWSRMALWQRLWDLVTSLRFVLHHHKILGLIMMAVMISVMATLALGGRYWLERPKADEIQFAANARLAFVEEKLVPPPPLPPSIFVGSDRPALESADRDWAKLQPAFRQTLLTLMARLSARGYDFALLEGYRSPERQETLAALGAHMTRARAYESRHQFGMAADLAPMRNGALAFNVDEPWTKSAYMAFGEESVKLGMVWGGNWKLQDYGHVEFR